ncbi:MAG: SEC-C domain-containing protein [Steroidobacteraceae bacterium]
MTHDPSTVRDPFDLPALLDDAVDVALSSDEPAALVDWLCANLAFYAAEGSQFATDPELRRAFAFGFGRAMWNALPLPGNGFRPAPVPEPGRNDPCPCGSGRKYKQCCQRLPPLGIVTAPMLWPSVLRALEGLDRAAALDSRQLPREALHEFLSGELEAGRAAEVIALLEPRFGDPPAATDELAADLLDLLCDAYDCANTGRRRKRRVLDRLCALSARSPLRAGAQQRLAAIAMDEGRADRAWDLFREAQRSNPDDPSLGILEVQLLYSEGRLDEVRSRAAFHRAQLQRRDGAEDTHAVEFFDRMARDPTRAMSDVVLQMEGGGAALAEWLDRVRDRPLPAYRPVADRFAGPGSVGDSVTRSLRQLGLTGAALDRARDDALAELERLTTDDARVDAGSELRGPDDADLSPAPDGAVLQAPETLSTVEAKWRELFPLPKPFSVHPLPRDDSGVWDEEVESAWMGFLDAHPEAFDSLDILDDLTSAVFLHPGAEHEALLDRLAAPLLTRSCAVVDAVLAASPEVALPWVLTDNRPALRALMREFERQRAAGRDTAAMTRAAQMLALNPGDNHGVRFVLACHHLTSGCPQRCIELTARYPEDPAPELRFNEALAHYQLGHAASATEALREAHRRMPKVARYLLPSRVRKPKFSPYGVQVGGDDQAWLYREAMREVWKSTAGALAWASQVVP